MDMSEARIREVMPTDVKTLDANDTLDVAEDLMATHRIRHVPVIGRDAHVVGVPSRSDLFPQGLAGALGYGAVGPRKLLHVMQVKEVMSRPPLTITLNATVRDAGVQVLDRKIGCLPVVENGRLVGIVTEGDLLRCLTGLEAGVAHA